MPPTTLRSSPYCLRGPAASFPPPPAPNQPFIFGCRCCCRGRFSAPSIQSCVHPPSHQKAPTCWRCLSPVPPSSSCPTCRPSRRPWWASYGAPDPACCPPAWEVQCLRAHHLGLRKVRQRQRSGSCCIYGRAGCWEDGIRAFCPS